MSHLGMMFIWKRISVDVTLDNWMNILQDLLIICTHF